MTRSFFVLTSLTLSCLLVACGGGSKTKPLEGQRERILPGRVVLQEGVFQEGSPINLPEATANTHWPQTGGGASHSGGHFSLNKAPTEAWRTSVGGSNEEEKLLNPPVVAEGRTFVLSPQGVVTALDTAKGKKVWSKKLKSEEKAHLRFSGGVVTDGTRVYVTTGTGRIFALSNETGAIEWQRDVGVPVRTAPIVYNNFVYAVGHNNRLFALKRETGALAWTHSGIEEDLVLLGGAPVTAVNGAVIAPYSSGEIYVLSAQEGRYVWHDALSSGIGSDPLSALVDIQAAPAVSDGVVYAVNHNGQLSAFRLEDGRRLWEREISAIQMPWVAGNALFLVNEQSQLVALSKKDASLLWVQNLNNALPKKREEAALWAGPILAGERLIVVSDNGYMAMLDPQSGQLTKISKLPGGSSLPPVVADGTLYVLTDSGKLVAYR